ncbi:hypothetical protein HETIRDRAFT_414845 [Heterobasidion irregulare TC 32-1]|uniref:Uncharacterized protein n=1 Tax=Heterobasidion irregulare (strain TC 32-1) TaxID=747525 RepID=W4KLE8_HETIT|nr:uncharacterized protein HETIRDRAFT_414845 [Heterobasidion irregulare TC 32-1]ETW85866.1 hypothetical protein HETIRDRAFT_414845 [Heterobasidion irregulare TC 32-1]
MLCKAPTCWCGCIGTDRQPAPLWGHKCLFQKHASVMHAELTESLFQPIENLLLPSSNAITNLASNSSSSLIPAVPASMVPALFLYMTASFPYFDKTMALPAYLPLLIRDSSESGSMPMEFWNALVNSLPVPANDPFAALISND